MAGEEDKGFKVVDRRIPLEEPAQPDSSAKKEGVEGPGWKMREAQAEQPLPPMDFTTFCLSLASSAMIHLGTAVHPETGKSDPNLPLAKQTIDILELLETKTRNNLTPDEARLLGALLYDLRMRFLEAKGK